MAGFATSSSPSLMPSLVASAVVHGAVGIACILSDSPPSVELNLSDRLFSVSFESCEKMESPEEKINTIQEKCVQEPEQLKTAPIKETVKKTDDVSDYGAKKTKKPIHHNPRTHEKEQKLTGTSTSTQVSVFAFPGNLKPIYPVEARDKNIEATVNLRLTINQLGTVEKVEVLSPQVQRCFIDAALKAAYQWQFTLTGTLSTPTMEVDIPFVFKMT